MSGKGHRPLTNVNLQFSHVFGRKDGAGLDIVFIHGLTGDPNETWTTNNGDFWPSWLADDLPAVCIYTAGYPSSHFEKWSKKEMDLHERASSLLEHLVSHGIGGRPLALVCHSLGGILAKEMLRAATESQDENWNLIADQLKLVVFIATPHKGAALAQTLRFAAPRISSAFLETLSNKSGILGNLFNSYRDLAERKHITTIAYYEKFKTSGVALVVTSDSADPGALETRPIPIDADHITICKPESRDASLYISLRRHVKRALQVGQLALSGGTTPASAEAHGQGASRFRTEWFVRNLEIDDLPPPLVEVEPVISREELLRFLAGLLDRNTVAPVAGPPRSGKSSLIRSFVQQLKDGVTAGSFAALFVDLEAKRPYRAFLRSAGYRGEQRSVEYPIDQAWEEQSIFTNHDEVDELLSFQLPHQVRGKTLIVVIQRYDSIVDDEVALHELRDIFRSEALRHAFVVAEVGTVEPRFDGLRTAPATDVGFLDNAEVVRV